MNFAKLPLNTQRSYVMAKDQTGTEIWIPTITRDTKERKEKRKQLETFLASQPSTEVKA